MTAADSTTRPKRMRASDRREQILREAYGLIARVGFNAVSLSDVARACHIEKSAVLHYFPTMNNLLMEVLAVRERQVYDRLRDDPASADPSTPVAAREVITRVFLHQLERPEFVRLESILSVEALGVDHPAHEYFERISRSSVEEAKRALVWKPDPEVAAVELLAFTTGLHLAWLHDPELDIRRVWESFCDRFFA